MTSVLDLNTGTFTDYTLSPWEAVRAAYAQREKHNFNTWTYAQYDSLVTVSDCFKPGIVCVTCGNQSALARKGDERKSMFHSWEAEKTEVQS